MATGQESLSWIKSKNLRLSSLFSSFIWELRIIPKTHKAWAIYVCLFFLFFRWLCYLIITILWALHAFCLWARTFKCFYFSFLHNHDIFSSKSNISSFNLFSLHSMPRRPLPRHLLQINLDDLNFFAGLAFFLKRHFQHFYGLNLFFLTFPLNSLQMAKKRRLFSIFWHFLPNFERLAHFRSFVHFDVVRGQQTQDFAGADDHLSAGLFADCGFVALGRIEAARWVGWWLLLVLVFFNLATQTCK